MKRILFVFAAILLLSGCATTGKISDNDNNEVNTIITDDIKLKMAIMSYFKAKSEFAGIYKITTITQMQLEKVSENKCNVNTSYSYLPVLGNKQGKTDSGTDKRVFNLTLTKDSFEITGMGGPNSAVIKEEWISDQAKNKSRRDNNICWCWCSYRRYYCRS